MSIWDSLEWFKREEFKHPDEMDHILLLGLDQVREEADVAMYVTSDYRPGDPRSHGEGKAVDVSDNLNGEPVSGAWRFKVVGAALRCGFVRVGVYDRHIHLDISLRLPQEVLWSGISE